MKNMKKEFEKAGSKECREKRRSFLKKVAYAAPTLVVLGRLAGPADANAGFGPPPSDPVWQ